MYEGTGTIGPKLPPLCPCLSSFGLAAAVSSILGDDHYHISPIDGICRGCRVGLHGSDLWAMKMCLVKAC